MEALSGGIALALLLLLKIYSVNGIVPKWNITCPLGYQISKIYIVNDTSNDPNFPDFAEPGDGYGVGFETFAFNEGRWVVDAHMYGIWALDCGYVEEPGCVESCAEQDGADWCQKAYNATDEYEAGQHAVYVNAYIRNDYPVFGASNTLRTCCKSRAHKLAPLCDQPAGGIDLIGGFFYAWPNYWNGPSDVTYQIEADYDVTKHYKDQYLPRANVIVREIEDQSLKHSWTGISFRIKTCTWDTYLGDTYCDPCLATDGGPCKNGGTCLSPTTFPWSVIVCNCTPANGYTGPTCEIPPVVLTCNRSVESYLQGAGYIVTYTDSMTTGEVADGENATVTCDDEHELNLEGLPEFRCVSGEWQGLSPDPWCIPKNCAMDLVAPSGGTIEYENATVAVVGSTASVVCSENYVLTNPENNPVTCERSTGNLSENVWSSTTLPTCVGTCPLTFNFTDHGNISYSEAEILDGRVPIGTTVSVTCDDGYEAVGGGIVNCTSADTYDGDADALPVCQEMQCDMAELTDAGNLTFPVPGSMPVGSTADAGTTVKLTCDAGFEPADNNSNAKQCSKGAWLGDVGSCVEINRACPPTHGIKGYLLNYTEAAVDGFYPMGTIGSQYCPDGYTDDGGSTKTCTAAGWTGSINNCTPSACAQDRTVANAAVAYKKIVGGEVPHLGIYEIYCDDGYTRVNSTDMEICYFGEWTGTAGSCEPRKCANDLSAVSMHGVEHSYTYTAGEFSDDGATTTLTCLEPYETATDTLTCTNGMWEAATEQPKCILKQCNEADFTTPDNATSISVTEEYTPVDTHATPTGDSPIYSAAVLGNCSEGYSPATTNLVQVCGVGITIEGSPTQCIEGSTTSAGACAQDLAVAHNGNITYDVDGNALLTCDDGFALVGAANAACVDGAYTPELGYCDAEPCPVSTSITNGGVILHLDESGDAQDGSAVTVYCDQGYELSNEDGYAICKDTLLEDHDWPTCEASSCSKSFDHIIAEASLEYTDEDPDNGDFVLDGGTVTLTCEDGYVLAGDGAVNATCSAGVWSESSLETCTRSRCEAPTNTSGGVIVYTTTVDANGTYEYGTLAQVKCSVGYVNERGGENPAVKCNGTGWEGELTTCVEAFCTAFAFLYEGIDPDTTNFNLVDDAFADSVTIGCEAGYSPCYPDPPSCASGMWENPEKATCCEDSCVAGDLMSIEHGGTIATNTTARSTAVATCDAGYTKSREQSELVTYDWLAAICVKGDWVYPENFTDTCQPMDCEMDMDLSHQTVEYPDGGKDGSVANYTCDQGLALDGGTETTQTRTCTAGQYSGTPLGCYEMGCDKADLPVVNCSTNGVIADCTTYTHTTSHLTGSGLVRHNGKASFECPSGFANIGGEAVCSSGNWTVLDESLWYCFALGCSALDNVQNGEYVYSDEVNYADGSTVALQCDAGFYHEGSDALKIASFSATCSGGTWSTDLAGGARCLEKYCNATELTDLCDSYTALNGSCDPSKALESVAMYPSDDPEDMHPPNTVVTGKCGTDSEYIDADSRHSVVCQQGEWVGNMSGCQARGCQYYSANLHITNGYRSYSDNSTDDGYKMNGTVAYHNCFEGYEIESIDNATESTCINGGWDVTFANCVEKQCDVRDASFAESIILILNACESNPCQNDGTCYTPDGLNYTCDCRPGFSGDNCTIESWKNGWLNYETSDNTTVEDWFIASKSRVNYQCKPGYTFSSDALDDYEGLTCQAGAWVGQLSQCIEESCRRYQLDSELLHGTLSYSDGGNDTASFPAGGTNVTLICDDGYAAGANDTATCTQGVWTPSLAPCVLGRTCLTTDLLGANVSVTEGTVSVCDDCDFEISYLDEAPFDNVVASDVDFRPLLNGVYDTVKYGTIAVLTCKDHALVFSNGERTRKISCDSGTWSDDLTANHTLCAAPCAWNNPCQNEGTCVNVSRSRYEGDSDLANDLTQASYCQCPPHATGIHCEWTCGENITLVHSQQDFACFSYSNESLTWDAAQQFCLNKRAMLPVFPLQHTPELGGDEDITELQWLRDYRRDLHEVFDYMQTLVNDGISSGIDNEGHFWLGLVLDTTYRDDKSCWHWDSGLEHDWAVEVGKYNYWNTGPAWPVTRKKRAFDDPSNIPYYISPEMSVGRAFLEWASCMTYKVSVRGIYDENSYHMTSCNLDYHYTVCMTECAIDAQRIPPIHYEVGGGVLFLLDRVKRAFPEAVARCAGCTDECGNSATIFRDDGAITVADLLHFMNMPDSNLDEVWVGAHLQFHDEPDAGIYVDEGAACYRWSDDDRNVSSSSSGVFTSMSLAVSINTDLDIEYHSPDGNPREFLCQHPLCDATITVTPVRFWTAGESSLCTSAELPYCSYVIKSAEVVMPFSHTDCDIRNETLSGHEWKAPANITTPTWVDQWTNTGGNNVSFSFYSHSTETGVCFGIGYSDATDQVTFDASVYFSFNHWFTTADGAHRIGVAYGEANDELYQLEVEITVMSDCASSTNPFVPVGNVWTTPGPSTPGP